MIRKLCSVPNGVLAAIYINRESINMATHLTVPDINVCRTSQLYDSQCFICLVEDPSLCSDAYIVREFYMCDHPFKDGFVEAKSKQHLIR